MSASDRIAKAINCPVAHASGDAVERYERYWNIECPQDLKVFWSKWGSGKGFVSEVSGVPYVRFYSPEDALQHFGADEMRNTMPQGFAPIGSDGAGEMIVAVEDRGYGLLHSIHSGADDLMLVGRSLEEFFEKTERDEWFSELENKK